MNKKELMNKIMKGVKNSLNESKHLNEYAWNEETQSEHVEEKDLPNLSASDIELFHIAFDSLTNILIENGVSSQEEAEEYLPSVFTDVFDRIPKPLEVLAYLRKCMHIDWESLVDLDCTDVDSLETNYFEFATRAWFKAQNSVNESKTFDPKNNKQHREAYNSFVKWYNRWKEKLGREEIRGLVRKVTNDALGDNLDRINEAYKMPNPIVNTYAGPLPKVDSDDNTLYDEKTGETIATMDIKQYGYDTRSKCCIIKFKPGLSLQDKLNYRDAILKNRTLKSWFNISKSSFIYYQPELFESLNESGIPGPEDDHLAFDLFLTFQNTHELRDLSQPMVNNLIKRLRKGEKISIDILAASSIVEKYAKATIEEYKRTVDGAPSFVNTSTRKNLKRRIAQGLINDAKDDYAFELHDM